MIYDLLWPDGCIGSQVIMVGMRYRESFISFILDFVIKWSERCTWYYATKLNSTVAVPDVAEIVSQSNFSYEKISRNNFTKRALDLYEMAWLPLIFVYIGASGLTNILREKKKKIRDNSIFGKYTLNLGQLCGIRWFYFVYMLILLLHLNL